jgi:hypothetical protein
MVSLSIKGGYRTADSNSSPYYYSLVHNVMVAMSAVNITCTTVTLIIVQLLETLLGTAGNHIMQ